MTKKLGQTSQKTNKFMDELNLDDHCQETEIVRIIAPIECHSVSKDIFSVRQ